MFKDKKGISGTSAVVITFALIAVISFMLYQFINYGWLDAFTAVNIDTTTESWNTVVDSSLAGIGYIVGELPVFLKDFTSNEFSVPVIVFAMWLMIFLTFGDIFATFSTFSKPISWTLGFLTSVIFANFKLGAILLAFFVGIFSFLGAFAVLVGLFASFVAFIGVNWGIRKWRPWLMERRIMGAAQESAIHTEAGAKQLAAGVKGLGELTTELKNFDAKNK